MHCVPYSQNELLQYIILAMSIGPLYVIVIYYIKIFFYTIEIQPDVCWGSRDLIRRDVEAN